MIPILRVSLMYLIFKHTTIQAAVQKHLLLSDKLLTFSEKGFTFVWQDFIFRKPSALSSSSNALYSKLLKRYV